MYSLTEVQQFPRIIFEAPDDDSIGRNMQCTRDIKTALNLKNANFKTNLISVCDKWRATGCCSTIFYPIYLSALSLTGMVA
jgi:hypothetical protein